MEFGFRMFNRLINTISSKETPFFVLVTSDNFDFHFAADRYHRFLGAYSSFEQLDCIKLQATVLSKPHTQYPDCVPKVNRAFPVHVVSCSV